MLHEALMNDRFELAYQPIAAVPGGEEAHYQTLLRLRDADGNMHTAAETLPADQAAGEKPELDTPALELPPATPAPPAGETSPVSLLLRHKHPTPTTTRPPG